MKISRTRLRHEAWLYAKAAALVILITGLILGGAAATMWLANKHPLHLVCFIVALAFVISVKIVRHKIE